MAIEREKVQSAGTTADILKALGRLGQPAPLSHVAEAAGMHAAKAHRYLQALIQAGLATQDRATGHYGMGPEMVAIGLAALAGLDLVEMASAELFQLRDRVRQTSILSVWGTAGPTVVRVAQSISPITVATPLGTVLPLRSATGIVFGALFSAERLRTAGDYPEFLSGGGPFDVARAVDLTRTSGVAIVNGLLLPGIAAIAAPILDALDDCVGVLCSLGPAETFDHRPDGVVASEVRRSATEVSRRMGNRTALEGSSTLLTD